MIIVPIRSPVLNDKCTGRETPYRDQLPGGAAHNSTTFLFQNNIPIPIGKQALTQARMRAPVHYEAVEVGGRLAVLGHGGGVRLGGGRRKIRGRRRRRGCGAEARLPRASKKKKWK